MRSRARAGGLLVVGILALVLLLLLGHGAPVPAPQGLPDPGRLTGWALPLTRFAADAAGLVVVAALLVPVLVSTRLSEELRPVSARAVFSVRRTASLWAVLAVLELVLTYSDQFAVPVTEIRWTELEGFVRQVDQGQALLVQAALI
jgi:putative copper resistance protein D